MTDSNYDTIKRDKEIDVDVVEKLYGRKIYFFILEESFMSEEQLLFLDCTLFLYKATFLLIITV